jgi:hypothetical protein
MKRTWLALGTALAAIGLVLWLPAPKRPAAATSPPPPTLQSVWPNTKPFTFPANFPDGSAYSPLLILDPYTSVGTVAVGGGTRIDLDVVPADGPPRTLQSKSVADGGSFDGLAATADNLYWMHSLSDTNSNVHVSIWTAPRAGGAARQLSPDAGSPQFYGSQYDVQPVGDRLYWTAARPDRTDQTELRSIPLTGGTATVKVLEGAWALSRWPWLVTAPGNPGQPTRLSNMDTRQVIAVQTPPGKLVTCTPTWCRLVPDNAAGSQPTDLQRPDGTDTRTICDADTAAIATDIALLDRYELLMTTQNPTALLAVSKVSLYDITHRRTVQIAPATTGAGARGNYIWWATGDNETQTWHGLDLRTLN